MTSYSSRGRVALADGLPLHRRQIQDFNWPPKLNEPYPDLHLVDQDGKLTRLSEFKGKIILVEPIGMPCQACQAFCGGHHVGGFRGIRPQPSLPSIEESAQDLWRLRSVGFADR